MVSQRFFLSVACVLLAAVSTSGTETSPGSAHPMIVGDEYLKTVRQSLVGEWSCEVGPTKRQLKFHDDGRFEMGDKSGPYRVENHALTLQVDSGEIVYKLGLSGKELTLTGGDLAGSLKFTKVSRFGESRDWRTRWSWSALKMKARRIVTIVLIVVVCLAMVRLVRAVMHMVIYSEWGPLGFAYRRHKKRTMTIYSLALNISKYAIYLLAIGFILTELGVNYRLYFASLSVVGLAIGFGSQGLVQDMVTGFFIVFEEQFNVGDMVEIPPHTGVVEELGLRMTRLRNYLGQRVAIPNRNIAVVGNYLRGAQQVYLDIALAADANTEKAAGTLQQTAQDIAEQFQDIILSPPEMLGEISLSTGERFLRLHLTIWPQQQWVIDQEMTPRLRAAMRAEGFDIPGDRIVVFYHPRESRSIARAK